MSDGESVPRGADPQFWFRDGVLHRDDGPAVTFSTGNLTVFRSGDSAMGFDVLTGGGGWYLNGKMCEGVEEWIASEGLPHWSEWTDRERVMFQLRFGDA